MSKNHKKNFPLWNYEKKQWESWEKLLKLSFKTIWISCCAIEKQLMDWGEDVQWEGLGGKVQIFHKEN